MAGTDGIVVDIAVVGGGKRRHLQHVIANVVLSSVVGPMIVDDLASRMKAMMLDAMRDAETATKEG